MHHLGRTKSRKNVRSPPPIRRTSSADILDGKQTNRSTKVNHRTGGTVSLLLLVLMLIYFFRVQTIDVTNKTDADEIPRHRLQHLAKLQSDVAALHLDADQLNLRDVTTSEYKAQLRMKRAQAENSIQFEMIKGIIHCKLIPLKTKGAEYPLITVTAPTSTNRAKFQFNIYSSFFFQHYPNKELLVIENGDKRSEFWTAMAKVDPRVRYFYFESMGLGEKRNLALKEARGKYIAHFDDDDYYSRHYLSYMYNSAIINKKPIVKLGSWINYSGHFHNDVLFGEFLGINTTSEKTQVRLGYAFTYFYELEPVRHIQYPDGTFEDWPWIKQALKENIGIAVVQDKYACVVKIENGENTSRSIGIQAPFISVAYLKKRVLPHMQIGLPVRNLPQDIKCTKHKNKQPSHYKNSDPDWKYASTPEYCGGACAVVPGCTHYKHIGLEFRCDLMQESDDYTVGEPYDWKMESMPEYKRIISGQCYDFDHFFAFKKEDADYSAASTFEQYSNTVDTAQLPDPAFRIIRDSSKDF